MQFLGAILRGAAEEYREIEKERQLARPDESLFPKNKMEKIDTGAGLPPDEPDEYVTPEASEQTQSSSSYFPQKKFSKLSSENRKDATHQTPLDEVNINQFSPDVIRQPKAIREATESEIEQMGNERLLDDELVGQNFASIQPPFPRSPSEPKEGKIIQSLGEFLGKVVKVAGDEYQKIREEREQERLNESLFPENKEEEIDTGAGLPPDEPDEYEILEAPEPPQSPPSSFFKEKFNELSSRISELATGQMPFHGNNINPLSPDVTEQSKVITKAAANEIEQISNERLPDKFVAQNFANIQPRPKSLSEQKKAEVDALAEKKVHNYEKLQECRPALIAYTMFSIFELVVNDPYPTQKDPTIYPRMTSRAVEEGTEADLWQIYVEEKEQSRQKLSKFSYIKAKFLYLLFYQITNFVPQIIDALTTQKSLECIRKHITDPKTLNSLSSKILHYIELYLGRMKLALEEKNREGQTKTLDECKETIFSQTFPSEFKSLIQECVSEMMFSFFPHISFCDLWKNHPSPLFRELGQIISTPLNKWLNLITQIALERIVFPSILQSTLTSFIQDKKKEYIFSRGLYRTAARKMIEMRENLNKPKAVEGTPSSGVPLEVNILERIAKLATEVYLQDLPKAMEEPDSFFLGNFKRKLIHPLIKIGIVEGGKIALPRLYDPEVIENLFTTLIETSLSALTQLPESYEKLVEDHDKSLEELEEAKKLLFEKIDRQIFDIQLAPKDEFLEQQMQASLAQIRYELFGSLSSLEKSRITLKRARSTIEKYFDKERNQQLLETPPEEAFQAMHDILNALQNINECLDLNKIAKKHFQLTAEQKQKLDCALQPIREKFLQLVQIAREFNQYQNTHYLCARLYEMQNELATTMEIIDDQLERKTTNSLERNFTPVKDHLHNLALFSKPIQLIQEETEKSLQELYQTISRALKTIEKEDRTIQGLKSLIESDEDGSPPLIEQLIYSPHSADLKQKVQTILQQADIANPRLLSKIDQMSLYVSSLWRGEWNMFETFILEQIPESQKHLKNQIGLVLAKYSKLPQGKHFPLKLWEADIGTFTQDVRQEDRHRAGPLLSQIEAFLRTGSLLSAQWNQFCHELRLQIKQKTQIRNNAFAVYQEYRLRLQNFQEKQIETITEAQRDVSLRLNQNLKGISSHIDELKSLIEQIKTKKSYSPIQVLTGGFMVGGAFIGTGATLVAATGLVSTATIAAAVSGAIGGLSSLFNPEKNSLARTFAGIVSGFTIGGLTGPLGPILSGAIAGAYMGREFPENAKQFSERMITGEVNTFVKRITDASIEPSTKKFAISGTLEAISKKSSS